MPEICRAILEQAKRRALGQHGPATKVGGLNIIREFVHLRTSLGSAALPPFAVAKGVHAAVAGKDERVLTAARDAHSGGDVGERGRVAEVVVEDVARCVAHAVTK
eukprot:2384372-Prymnesium_polylepis.1